MSNVAQGTFYDARDNKPYTVRKLADSNCWMVDDLKYEITSVGTYKGVNNTTGQEFNFAVSSSDICTGDNECLINGNTRYGDKYDTWYYSWYIATAGSGKSSTTSGDAVNSICPKNWRLPANYANSQKYSYGSITNAYFNFTSAGFHSGYMKQFMASPFSPSIVGNYVHGTFNDDNTTAYWTTTPSSISGTPTYVLYISYSSTNDFINPQYGGHGKWDGFSVRCVVL